MHTNIGLEERHLAIANWLVEHQFEPDEVTQYVIRTTRKLGFTFMSLFAFKRPEINWTVLLTKEGRITVESEYDYNSLFGIAMNDMGKQKKLIREFESYIKTLDNEKTL